MKTLAILILLALTGCSSTSKDRMEQLTKKDPNDCISGLAALQSSPAKELALGQAAPGELDDNHCFILPDGMRTSFDIYEFVATAVSHSLDIITFEKARGMGLGGENTIAIPQITLLQNGAKAPTQVRSTEPQWVRDFFNGDRLKTSFVINQLIPSQKYRIIVTTNNRTVGKELGGYHSTMAHGDIVSGPLGKLELTIK